MQMKGEMEWKRTSITQQANASFPLSVRNANKNKKWGWSKSFNKNLNFWED